MTLNLERNKLEQTHEIIEKISQLRNLYCLDKIKNVVETEILLIQQEDLPPSLRVDG